MSTFGKRFKAGFLALTMILGAYLLVTAAAIAIFNISCHDRYFKELGKASTCMSEVEAAKHFKKANNLLTFKDVDVEVEKCNAACAGVVSVLLFILGASYYIDLVELEKLSFSED